MNKIGNSIRDATKTIATLANVLKDALNSAIRALASLNGCGLINSAETAINKARPLPWRG